MEHLTPEEREVIEKNLLAKKAELEEELSRIAKRDPDAAGNWNATFEDMGDEWDDKVHEVSEFDLNTSLEQTLETHLKKITDALSRIEQGTYGICEVGGEPIDTRRLMTYPETTRCQKHAED